MDTVSTVVNVVVNNPIKTGYEYPDVAFAFLAGLTLPYVAFIATVIVLGIGYCLSGVRKELSGSSWTWATVWLFVFCGIAYAWGRPTSETLLFGIEVYFGAALAHSVFRVVWQARKLGMRVEESVAKVSENDWPSQIEIRTERLDFDARTSYKAQDAKSAYDFFRPKLFKDYLGMIFFGYFLAWPLFVIQAVTTDAMHVLGKILSHLLQEAANLAYGH